jgi:RNA polymerase sigma factor (sigma-70 family)
MRTESSHLFEGNREFLEQFRRGDRHALEQVYWFYVDRVERLVRSCLASVDVREPGSAANVEDVVQDVFARAFGPAARESYDGLRDYGPYLFTVARHSVADALRLSRREVLADLDNFASPATPGGENATGDDEQWADASVMALVRSYVAGLAPDLRDLHHQRYVLGLSQDRAAAALGISRQNVRTLEKKLRVGLIRELKRPRVTKRPTEVPAMPVLKRG